MNQIFRLSIRRPLLTKRFFQWIPGSPQKRAPTAKDGFGKWHGVTAEGHGQD